MPDRSTDIDFNRVLFGNDFSDIHEAILADIVSSIPIIGELTDIVRVSNADTRRKRTLQTLDTITGPLPTPTNTLLFLDKQGTINLGIVDNLLEILQLVKRR